MTPGLRSVPSPLPRGSNKPKSGVHIGEGEAHAQSVDKKSSKARIKPQHTLALKASSEPSKTTSSKTFNPKSIVPLTKATKNLDHLRSTLIESEKSFDRIDDDSKTIPQSYDDKENHGEFRAWGIEAYPTKAIFEDICFDYLAPHRSCHHGKNCHRIHPKDKAKYLAEAVEVSAKYRSMKKTSSRGSDTSTIPSKAEDSSPSIVVKLPPSGSFHLGQSSHVTRDHITGQPQEATRKRPQKINRGSLLKTLPGCTITSKKVQNWDFIADFKAGWGSHPRVASSCTSSADSDLCQFSEREAETSPNPWREVIPQWHTDSEPSSNPQKSSVIRSNTFQEHSDSRPSSSSSTALGGWQREGIAPTESRYPQSFHQRPPTNERCRAWLRNSCMLGYNCRYIHDDLEYDPEPPPIKPSKPEDLDHKPILRPVVKPGPEGHLQQLHHHIRATFTSGFKISHLSTGFESPWISLGGIADLTDAQITDIMRPFGSLLEIRRPFRPFQPLVKVHFEHSSAAFAALKGLHGTKALGRSLEVKPGNENNYNRLVFHGNAVRFEWDVPHRTVFMGYANKGLADMAVAQSQVKPYHDFWTTASCYVGIPAVGRITVKFQHMPLEVSQDEMKIFGPHEGMVTERSSFKDCSAEDLIKSFRKIIFPLKTKITDVDIKPPPYRNGKMRAWVVFSNAKDAQIAAETLDGVSPSSMQGSKILARQTKSISFVLSHSVFRKVEGGIRALQESLHKENDGYWINIVEKGFFSIRISGDDIKGLGKIKADFERVIYGERVSRDGKAVWDVVFSRPLGFGYLMGLQREFQGVTIEINSQRQTIKLFGPPENRAIVRKRLIGFLEEHRSRSQHVIPLHPFIARRFMDEDDGLSALEADLGSENVHLDMWNNQLIVYGDADTYVAARDACSAFRRRIQSGRRTGEVCPACFGPTSSPVKLSCGHSWCRACLQRYLKMAVEKNTSFPLVCHGIDERCGEPIPIHIARTLVGTTDLEAIFTASLTSHIQTNPSEFFYCPTPDCQQVYRKTPEGIFMQCPECLCQICTHCNSEAHEGLTCSEVHDGDDLFKEWAFENNVKRCPGCRMVIEKLEGCNHMTCSMCKSHICWVCLEIFKDGYSIYGHMEAEHGGSGV